MRWATHATLLLWWAPTIVVLLARPALTRASFSYRTKRAERLLEVGDIVEADRVIARLRWEAERYRRRVARRSSGGVASEADLVKLCVGLVPDPDADRARTCSPSHLQGEHFEQKHRLTPSGADFVELHAEVVRDPASSMLDVEEEARHRRGLLSFGA